MDAQDSKAAEFGERLRTFLYDVLRARLEREAQQRLTQLPRWRSTTRDDHGPN